MKTLELTKSETQQNFEYFIQTSHGKKIIKNLQKAVSKDQIRDYLTYIHYNSEDKRLEATNAYILVMYNIDLGEDHLYYNAKENTFGENISYPKVKNFIPNLDDYKSQYLQINITKEFLKAAKLISPYFKIDTGFFCAQNLYMDIELKQINYLEINKDIISRDIFFSPEYFLTIQELTEDFIYLSYIDYSKPAVFNHTNGYYGVIMPAIVNF